VKYLAHFSCGAASATATKLAISEFGTENVRVIYLKTNSEHEDNERFLLECQDWFGVEVEQHQSSAYADIWDVFDKTRFLVGPMGARCTGELKRKVAESLINYGPYQETEILGYTAEEEKRVKQFIKQNNERKIYPILLDRGLTKKDCLGFVDRAGIELPAMYKLGYRNNNCIGCVKGQAGYWNKIKVDFPDVFERMAQTEERLGRTICKREWTENGERKLERITLRELPPDLGNYRSEPSIQCGLLCEAEFQAVDPINRSDGENEHNG
jgi:3'-phosphoadenosine 5'-phosphosulfate sulfotransferase (PAPS reductase)/FAD synthetase